ncbi:hypothetical protein CLV78_1269 [Aliiruegeria haliotis]|uniref:Uncharacterized protein n=1 Tax=Aliiruegeria haliotis TaxID=1280846 RepID=A0A2T0RDJ7_9RHOB|nr:hypothetical protein [Aliiruegeria haliotis]PRY19237.1 hypothetical protein CLV78_1269 [Aliiruegeria haliotis]
MTIQIPDKPFFLPPHAGENSGVDFLGLRQTNLDMMAEMIPSLNNVTDYIRPFSLLCWVYWKFYELCAENGVEVPTSEELNQFRERIEVLFTWGARLHETSGRIPGTGAAPPEATASGEVPLTFKAWKRVQSSTSLIAALWYGPASKTVTGLGFLMPVPGSPGFFRVVGTGIELAEALDSRLRENDQTYRHLLSTLSPVLASEADAIALWELWSPEQTTPGEQQAFASALYSANSLGSTDSLLSRRSTTLALALHHLGGSSAPLPARDIRRGMALSIASDGATYDVPDELKDARDCWLTLQMRQLQRLSLESLLSWCEACMLGERIHDTSAMAQLFEEAWDGSGGGFQDKRTVDSAIKAIEGEADGADAFVSAINEGRVPDPFLLIEEISAQMRDGDRNYVTNSFLGLLLCAAYAGLIGKDEPMINMGGSSRLSLANLRIRLVGLDTSSMREAFQYVLEALVISQHFATAVNRFDGQNQRLRLTIEETGLEALVSQPWHPSVTEDRLPTLLSLAAQAGLLTRTQDSRFAAKPQ